jgi:hypothetical protein
MDDEVYALSGDTGRVVLRSLTPSGQGLELRSVETKPGVQKKGS